MSPATAGASAAKAREHLLELLDPLVSAAGYELEDITVSAAGRRSLVRVIVDAEGGIDLDAVATVSRTVSDAIDADARSEALLAGAYVLEVSSPGVDRPLTTPRQWRRATGRLVRAHVRGKEMSGRVTSVEDDGVHLSVSNRPSMTSLVSWSDLGPGKVQVEFNRSDEER